MKNWVSWMKLIQIPTSIGMMWISSSSRIAGRTSRYGVAPFQRGRRRPRGRGDSGGGGGGGTVPSAELVELVVVTGTGLSLTQWRSRPREAAAGREQGQRLPSAGGGHLVLRRLHRGLDVGVGHVLASGCLGEQAVDGVADVGLERGLRGDERERLGLGGQDLRERIGLGLVVSEVHRAALDHRKRRERLVQDGLLLRARQELDELQRRVLVLRVLEDREVDPGHEAGDVLAAGGQR